MTLEQIDELETWFNAQDLPESYRINRAFFLPNVKHHLELEFHYLRANLHKPFLAGPVIERLEKLKKCFSGDVHYSRE